MVLSASKSDTYLWVNYLEGKWDMLISEFGQHCSFPSPYLQDKDEISSTKCIVGEFRIIWRRAMWVGKTGLRNGSQWTIYTQFLCFLSRKYPVVFVGELVWWCRILSAFACLKSFWFLIHTWMRSLLGTIIWAVGYFLSSFIKERSQKNHREQDSPLLEFIKFNLPTLKAAGNRWSTYLRYCGPQYLTDKFQLW